jgi:hypothetical protein
LKASFYALLLAALLALTALPTTSGKNIDHERESSPITTVYNMDMIDLDKVATIRSDGTSDANQPAYLCGYDLSREHRGDCDTNNVDIAPGERWYKFTTSDLDMGNIYIFAIENLGEPHLVDVTVEVCFSDTFVNGTLHCYDWDEMYGDQTLRYTFTPIVIREIWFHLVAWDEEKESRDPVPGGDRTKVEIYMENKFDSNADEQNPTPIVSEGQKFERRVCEINCFIEDNLDPLDVFVYEGLAGDRIVIDFGSREKDWWSDHDLKVKYLFETDAHTSGRIHPYYLLDDQYHYDTHNGNGDGISTIDYTFHTSGDLYVWFEALLYESSNRDGEAYAESFKLEVITIDERNRDELADRDLDELPDAEEIRCGSDYKDPNDTAPDWDRDKTCDEFDLDLDGDSVPNAIDACLFSINWGTTDHDGDGCFDIEDQDMDNDGLANIPYDQCELGVLGNGVYDPAADRDGDGCHDTLGLPNEASDLTEYGEDTDDDGDGILDATDACTSNSSVLYEHETWVDGDNDGCHDTLTRGWNASLNQTDYGEDNDDDNDGTLDWEDDCPNSAGPPNTDLKGCPDSDGDAFSDQTDQCPNLHGESYNDRNGCPDTDGDGFSDAERNWTFEDGADKFPEITSQWGDSDGDGFGDNEGAEQGDDCKSALGFSYIDKNGCPDDDGDGYSNQGDPCLSDAENTCWAAVADDPSKILEMKGGVFIPTTLLLVAMFRNWQQRRLRFSNDKSVNLITLEDNDI